MSDWSALRIGPLDNTFGTVYSPALSLYVLVSSSSLKIDIGPQFKVSSGRLEELGIVPLTQDSRTSMSAPSKSTLRERLRTHKVFTKIQCFYLNYHKFSIKSYVLNVY